jgi:hypothetical protein
MAIVSRQPLKYGVFTYSTLPVVFSFIYFCKGLLYFTETLSYKNFVFQHKKQPILFLLIAGPSAIRERAMKNVFLMPEQ